MPPVNPAAALYAAPLSDLIVLLLKQLQRLLAERGAALTTAQMAALAAAAADHAPLPPPDILPALRHIVAESETVLREQFQLSYAAALATTMDTLGGWHTTADFLALAGAKSNAELRISAAATLLLCLGDASARHHLETLIAHDAGLDDVEAVLAKRALAHRL
ncbi:MAG: hypothetical protein MUE40_11160 [Anaerolineae bacterium]|jgi:hypothetical protein|nr:hypothetical protein [Anaerolineae bacterium]